MTLNQYEAYLEGEMPEMMDLLKELVNIDSGSYFKEGVDKVDNVLRKEFENLGMGVIVHREAEYGNHLEINNLK